MIQQSDDFKANDSGIATPSSVVDWSVLDDLKVLQKPGKPDLGRNLITVYLSSLPQLFESAKDALKASDGEALMKAAHSMKSSSLAIGAVVFGETCAELEQLGKANDLENTAVLMGRAENEYAATCSAFRDALGQKG